MKFVPIHNHSEYSALDGLATCKEIAERAVELGCPCCGITDHGTVAGHLEFGKVMKANGLKPIYGCELYHGVKTEFGKNERDASHFVAGAMTDGGLRNLWRLVDFASTNFRYVGRVNWDALAQHSEGVFATSACIQGLVSRGVLGKGDWDPYEPLNRYLEIFGDNFYIELHTYPGEEHERLNMELAQIAQERGIPLIYATDAHYAFPNQYEVHDAYVAMHTGENIFIDPEDRKMWHPKSLYIQSEEEIRASLFYLSGSQVDEALSNSAELADKCNAELPEVKRHLATFHTAECPWVEAAPDSAGTLLLDLVEKGLINRYGEDADEEVWERAERELQVFLEAGLEHYFLQAWDLCQFCDRNNIKRGPGRGSAAGSIISYALGITDVDPLHYGLIFERFYNPGREKGFPDIDIDFPKKERKRVRQYLMDRWGHDRVRTIGTVTRMKPKAVIDKTYKACGITWDEKESLKKLVDQVPDIDILGSDSIGWTEEVDPGKTIYVMHSTPQSKHDVGNRVAKWVSEQGQDRIPFIEYWLEIVAHVCSRVSGYGVHPSGVVVSDVDLQDELPCMWNSKQEVQVTCFSMADVDSRQFVKEDVLGLRSLDTLQEWEDLVADEIEVTWSGIDRVEHPEAMWEMLDRGLTLGIFQIEDGHARHLCKELKPRSVEDLGIIVALNRPGPMRSGAPDSFITRRNGGEDDKFDGRKIPLLKEILEPTLGWFLYQEQVIAFFSEIGYDLSDADAVRKILGKKKPEDMQALHNGEGEWEGKGYQTMALAAGLDEQTFALIWEIVEDFAKYSFNKSHAICYGVITLRTLYAMYMSSPHYLIACIRTNADSAGKYVSQGRRMDIQVLPPDIQRSEADIAVADGDILFGFSNVKGIGKGSARYLVGLRDGGHDLWSPEHVYDAIECEQLLWERDRDIAKENSETFKKKSPRQNFRQNLINLLLRVGAFDMNEETEMSLEEKQQAQKELLGVILTDDCEAIFNRHLERIEQCDLYIDLESSMYGDQLQLPGIVTEISPKTTRKEGKAMGVITIEYEGEEVEFVVFPQQWRSYRKMWKERTPGIFTLKKNDRGVNLDNAVQLN